MKKLRSMFKNVSFTKTEHIIAEYLLDNYAEACFMTSTTIATNVGVSNSSIIRFSRKLGYSGFTDFQKILRQHYQDQVYSISHTITVPSQRFAKRMSLENRETYMKEHFKNAMNNLESALVLNTMETFERATNFILDSKRKFIVASRANTGTGDYFTLLMKHMLTDVYSTSHGAVNVIDHMIDIKKEDCVIVFSFPRYSELDRLALELASDAGAKIIVITDKQSALLAQYADILLLANCNSNTFFNSYIGAQFVAELLCDTVAQKTGNDVEKILSKVDKYIEQLGIY